VTTSTEDVLTHLKHARRDEIVGEGRELRTTLELLDTARIDEDGHREVVALVISTSNYRGDGANISRATRTLLVDRDDPGFLVFAAGVAPLAARAQETKRFSPKQLEQQHETFLSQVLAPSALEELTSWAALVRPAFIVHLRTDTASRVVMRTTSRDAAEERAALLESRRIQSAVVRVLELADAS
jgi:hypothetical protein